MPADVCAPDPRRIHPCIRVDVYRNQVRGNPLPVAVRRRVGLTTHGCAATATARVAVANASDCLKPWAIPDKWLDNYDVTAPTQPANTWTQDDNFETHAKKGNTYTPLANPDVYTPPSATSPGTGFTVDADLGISR